jgi:ferredoxin
MMFYYSDLQWRVVLAQLFSIDRSSGARWATLTRGSTRAKDVVSLRKEKGMPKLEVEGVGDFDVPEGKRLVLAIEEDAGVDILHRCGSYARCTTCRIEYLEGEPVKMTKAELEVLRNRDLLGQVRLSCQALCDHDVKVRVLMTVTSTGLDGPGNKPEPEITPPPEWVEKPS